MRGPRFQLSLGIEEPVEFSVNLMRWVVLDILQVERPVTVYCRELAPIREVTRL
jgi:hypothetical protein